MTRPLLPVPTHDPTAVLRALESALTGGPAVLPLAPTSPGRSGGPTGPDVSVASAALSAPPGTVPQRVALVVETSGSTGSAKRVALSADALLAGAAAADAALGGPGGWVLALPTHYIAGLNVLTRSIAAGTSPVVLPTGHFDAAVFADAVERLDADRTYTSLVPAQLARVLDDPRATEALTHLDAVLVGGQATPVPLLARARAAGATVVTTYGASETSGGCVYDGVPLGPVRTRLVEGGLELSGPMLAEGYLGDPDRTAASFVDGDGHRWYRTADAATIDGDGRVHVVGRLDDVLISGGEKVALGAVERVVREFPGLAGAVVTRRASPRWGEVPVVVTEVPVELATLREHVAAALGRAARPEAVVLVDAVPMLATGKPDRRAARAIADAQDSAHGS